jgi:hypothetical protein
VENDLDQTTLEGQVIRCLAPVPDIIQRGKRDMLGRGDGLVELREETRSLYEKLRATLNQLRARWNAIDAPGGTNGYSSTVALQLHAHYQRTYGLGLIIGIIINCVLGAFDFEDSNLMLESTSFSKEILALAEQAARYRPLGASYMVLCLMAAWIGTTDKSLRSLVERLLGDYQVDSTHRYMDNLRVELEGMSQHIRLLSPGYRSDLIKSVIGKTPS